MSENRLQKYILNNIDYTGHWCFVESKETSPGIPDLDFCIKGVEGKIEIKWGTNKKTPTLKPTQCAWFRRRVGAGGNCWLLLGWNNQGTDEFYLISGLNVPPLVHAKGYADWTKNYSARWSGNIEWSELINFICQSQRNEDP